MVKLAGEYIKEEKYAVTLADFSMTVSQLSD